MDRRTALKAISLIPFFSSEERTYDYGAVKPVIPSRRRSFGQEYKDFTNISKGKKALLWKYLETQLGNVLTPYSQQSEGDCVGCSYGLAVDVLMACDRFMQMDPEVWQARASVEMIYAGSRNEIGKQKFKGHSGSNGEWASKYLQAYGVLHQLQYPDLDLTGYDPKRSREYRDSGVPDALEPIAKERPILNYTKVTNWRMAFDCLYVGQPIVLCSTWAFRNQRDQDGFCEPYKSITYRRPFRTFDFRVKWFHAMALVGFDDTTSRPGGLIVNSHGNWNEGPKRYDQPDGSFFVDVDILDNMLTDWNDCYAISSYVGKPYKLLKHNLY
jgi:hypothetical protein